MLQSIQRRKKTKRRIDRIDVPTQQRLYAMSVCCVDVDLDGLDERWVVSTEHVCKGHAFKQVYIRIGNWQAMAIDSKSKKWAAIRPKAESKHKYYFNPHEYIASASHSAVQCGWIRQVLAPWYSIEYTTLYWFSFIKFWFDCQLNRHTFICFVCMRVRERASSTHIDCSLLEEYVAIGLPASLPVCECMCVCWTFFHLLISLSVNFCFVLTLPCRFDTHTQRERLLFTFLFTMFDGFLLKFLFNLLDLFDFLRLDEIVCRSRSHTGTKEKRSSERTGEQEM